jgi:hypothetical protein
MTSVINPNIDIQVTVLTVAFQIRGTYRGPSTIQTFLDDETKPTFSVFNANVLGVSLQNPAAQMFQPEMIVTKKSCHALIFEGVVPPGALVIPPNITPLIAYTDSYAVMGKFRLASGTSMTDFTERTPTPFIAVTEARLFTLFQGRPGIVSAATTALMRKELIRSYHRS